MKPKTDPQTGVTSPVLESKDRRVFADTKDRLLLYKEWQDDVGLHTAADEALVAITDILKAHANGEEGGDDSGDSNETETKE